MASFAIRGLEYKEANLLYASEHAAGTLTDADFVEWAALIRNHQQHHADGRMVTEEEYGHAARAVHALIDSVTLLTDAQREELRNPR